MLKIHLPSHAVRQDTVVQNLQQQSRHVAVRLFNLVQQYHAVGSAPHLFRQHAALVMPHIARRRADETRDGVLLHIFRHVDAHQRVGAAVHALRQRLAKLRFAHARRSCKQHRRNRPPCVGKPRPAAQDRPRRRAHRALLPDDTPAQRVVQSQKLLALALRQPPRRDARPLRDGLRHILGIQRPSAQMLRRGMLFAQHPLKLVAQYRRLLILPRGDRLLQLLRQRLLFAVQPARRALFVQQHTRRALVQKVKRLIRQKAVSDVAAR